MKKTAAGLGRFRVQTLRLITCPDRAVYFAYGCICCASSPSSHVTRPCETTILGPAAYATLALNKLSYFRNKFVIADIETLEGTVHMPDGALLGLGDVPCCPWLRPSSAEVPVAALSDFAVSRLAAVGASIRCLDCPALDCAAEHRARCAKRAAWRLAAYALLTLGDSCGVAPDVARQIVWMALPRVR